MQTNSLQKLLIVIKEHELAAHWMSLAEQAHATPTRCQDLPTAQATLAHLQPDTVVIDLDMTGNQVQGLLKMLRPFESEINYPWIIGLRTSFGKQAVEEAMSTGINNIINKNSDLDTYRKALFEADRVHHQHRLHHMGSPVGREKVALGGNLTQVSYP